MVVVFFVRWLVGGLVGGGSFDVGLEEGGAGFVEGEGRDEVGVDGEVVTERGEKACDKVGV